MDLLDFVLKSLVSISGIGLVGMMVVRTNARGRMKLVGLDAATLFDPRLKNQGQQMAWAFCVALG